MRVMGDFEVRSQLRLPSLSRTWLAEIPGGLRRRHRLVGAFDSRGSAVDGEARRRRRSLSIWRGRNNALRFRGAERDAAALLAP